MKLNVQHDSDDNYMGIVEFSLFMSSLPLIYILPLAFITLGIKYFRGDSHNVIAANYGSIPQVPSSIPVEQHQFGYFSKAWTSHYFICLAQIALTISILLFTLIFHPKPVDNSTALTKWYLIYLAYYIGYAIFLTSFHDVTLIKKGFLFVNFFAWSAVPWMLFFGFLFINGIDSFIIWCIYFTTFLAQCTLTSFIPIVDGFNLFKWLFSN